MFKELNKEELIQIISLMLDDLKEGLSEKEIGLDVDDKAKEVILDKSYKREYGARPMRRYIERHIEDALAHMLLTNDIKSGQMAVVTAEGGELKISAK